jgi:hypothetical protein
MIRLDTAASDVPVDFYAGAVAAFVVIVFAKFATHAHPRKRVPTRLLLAAVLGQGGHRTCIGLAWFGLGLALVVLGRGLLGVELALRWGVGLLALAAGGILSVDSAAARIHPAPTAAGASTSEPSDGERTAIVAPGATPQ